ncbi:MAG: hypothetical protein WAS27_03360 [Candidatus Saccharimonadales bacterium]
MNTSYVPQIESLDRSDHRLSIKLGVMLGAAAMLTATTLVDAGIGARARRYQSRGPEAHVIDGGGDNNAIIFAGCQQSYVDLVHLAETLAHEHSTVVTIIDHPQRSFSPDAEALVALEALRRLPKRARQESTLIGVSMGGKVASYALQHEAYSELTPDKLILDSSPFGPADLRGSAQFGAVASQLYPPTPITNAAYRGIITKLPANKRSTSQSLYAVSSQVHFIRDRRGLSHTRTGTDDMKVFYVSSPSDSTVNPVTAVASYEQHLYTGITHVIDPNRPDTSHAAANEYPNTITGLVRGDMPERYDVSHEHEQGLCAA